MLQKPGPKSKARDHVKYLTSRLALWKNGEIDQLLLEGNEIQKRILKNKRKKEESNSKAFTRLMLEGKVKQACKLINSDDCISGVHSITDDIKQALALKHPKGKAEEAFPDAMLPISKPPPNAVTYEQITA